MTMSPSAACTFPSFNGKVIRNMMPGSVDRARADDRRIEPPNLRRIGVVLAFALLSLVRSASAQTAFTYQGRLDENGSPASGAFDMRFHVYDEPIAGNQITGLLTIQAVPVEDGRFTTELDFLEITATRPAVPGNHGPPTRRPLLLRLRPASTSYRSPRRLCPLRLAHRYHLGRDQSTPGPLVGITASNPIATLHVERENLLIDASALAGDDVIIEAADAVLGLYSNAGGGFGSGVSLAEVTAGGHVTNKWLMIRETSPGGNGLRFVFGPGSNPGGAPPTSLPGRLQSRRRQHYRATCPAACGRRRCALTARSI